MVICVAFSLTACDFSEEFESEFAKQLQEEIEQEVNEAVEQTKKEVKKTVKNEAEKLKLRAQVTLFREKLKNVSVNKKNRAEMLYVMESILKLCDKNKLVYEAAEIRALYNMSTLMIDAESKEIIFERRRGFNEKDSLLYSCSDDVVPCFWMWDNKNTHL